MSISLSDIELISRNYASSEFDIQRECMEILHKKPKVSMNVLQAYHKEILEIAKASKQVLLDIAEKKNRFVSFLLQLEDDLQCEKTEEEKRYMEVASLLDDLKKSVHLGESEMLQLQAEGIALQQQIEEKNQFRFELSTIRTDQESEQQKFQEQVITLSSTLIQLQDKEKRFTEECETLSLQLTDEELKLQSCENDLENQYKDQVKSLEESVKSHQLAFDQFRFDYQQTNHAKSIETYRNVIDKLTSSSLYHQSQQKEAEERYTSLQQEINRLKPLFSSLQEEILSVTDRVTQSSVELTRLAQEKSENERFYHAKIEKLESEKGGMYERVVEVEVKKEKVMSERGMREKEREGYEKEMNEKEKEVMEVKDRLRLIVCEKEEGEQVMSEGRNEIMRATTQIEMIDNEILTSSSQLHTRNDKITSELESLAVKCEDVEDEVMKERKERTQQQYVINQLLASLEEANAVLSSRHTSLSSDVSSAYEMKNSSKENGQSRIYQLKQTIISLQLTLSSTSHLDNDYITQSNLLISLENKVQKSEKSRRILSDKIQTINGNNRSCIVIHNNQSNQSSYLLDVSPDETTVYVCSSSERTVGYTVDSVMEYIIDQSQNHDYHDDNDDIITSHTSNINKLKLTPTPPILISSTSTPDHLSINHTILDYIIDILYTSLDGYSFTLINNSTSETLLSKRSFLFNNTQSLVYQSIMTLISQTQRLESLHQIYHFYLSAISINQSSTSSSSSSFIHDERSVSVGESCTADDMDFHDLLELGRFSLDASGLHGIRRRSIKKQEDIENILGLVMRQKSSEGQTVIVTLTVEGKCEGKLSIGQVSFIDLFCEAKTDSQKQQMIADLLPAMDALFSSAGCEETVKLPPTSLPNILARLSNRGKIVSFNHAPKYPQQVDETVGLMSFAQLLNNCRLGPAKSRVSEIE